MISYTEDRQRYLDGSLSVSQRVEQCLATIDAQRDLNAFLHIATDSVRAAAAACDERFSAGLARPLEGCIVAVKDNMSVKGMPMTCASRILEGFMPLYTATAVERLLDAGAIIVGKTNMDEFAMGSSNETSAYGAVRNPHDSSRVPGGSSGGSAVAVAAGMCHVSLGSDTGGSIRQPAAFCGVVGYKPTYGAVSRYGLTAFASSLDHVGPFAPSVRDTQAVFDVMAGVDPMDSTSMSIPEGTPVPPIESVRVGVLDSAYIAGCEESIQQAYGFTVEHLQALGATIVPIQLQHEEAWVPTYFILATAEASSNLARFDGVRYGKRFDSEVDIVTETRSRGFGAEVQRRIMLGTYVLSSGYHDAYYTRAQKSRQLIAQMYRSVFQVVDVLLMPTTPTTAFNLGEKQADPVAMWLSDYYTVSANIAGIPAVSVPVGFDEQGLPIGMQVQGPVFADNLVLDVANHITASAG
jgi:aspartyl-tRNA(Asn)/glutamyl-tRNA(Gln) amidotransferase subunit A